MNTPDKNLLDTNTTIKPASKPIKRLQKRADFVATASRGKKWISKTVIVQVRPTPLDAADDDTIRLGFTVTKKQGNAVLRNRIKRRLREAGREIIAQYGKAGHDYVLIGRTLTASCPYEDLTRDLKWCLKRLGHVQK